jgi:hypothetical protein
MGSVSRCCCIGSSARRVCCPLFLNASSFHLGFSSALLLLPITSEMSLRSAPVASGSSHFSLNPTGFICCACSTAPLSSRRCLASPVPASAAACIEPSGFLTTLGGDCRSSAVRVCFFRNSGSSGFSSISISSSSESSARMSSRFCSSASSSSSSSATPAALSRVRSHRSGEVSRRFGRRLPPSARIAAAFLRTSIVAPSVSPKATPSPRAASAGRRSRPVS